ncbi:hypothetical protein [Streptomyces sparsogenes]|uniref:hypothetical protein n=1 Tax=Streptomyces sparsogenes TaxID=67365 RepID=UPI00117CF15B|nr:hypothetical protein [Streptomyces sparsogenes]
MTVRRTLGPGPQEPAPSIRAAEADLLDTLPGVHLPDLEEIRARGVLGIHTATPPPRGERSAPAAAPTPTKNPLTHPR